MSESRDFTEECLTTETGYKIVRTLIRGDANNPTAIAEEINSSYHSISNYMRGLRKRGIIAAERKEGRKKIYAASLPALYELVFELFTEPVPDSHIDSMKDSDLFDISEEHTEEFMDIMEKYFIAYCDWVEESTIQNMCVDDLLMGMYQHFSTFDEENDRLVHEDLSWLNEIEALFSMMYGFRTDYERTQAFGIALAGHYNFDNPSQLD